MVRVDSSHHRMISCVKHTLLVMHLIFILILVVTIVTSFALHGINPTLFLLTIFDLNSVIQLSETLQNTRDSATSAAYIAIHSPSAEFLFVALTLYITAIFNQVIAIVAIIRRHLCLLVFTLFINLTIFCLSVTFVKTNLFLLLVALVLMTIVYTFMLRQAKSGYSVHHMEADSHHHDNHHHHQQQQYSTQNMTTNLRVPPDGYHPATIDTTGQMYQPTHAAPSDPTKILAPIIYCPHYSESVC